MQNDFPYKSKFSRYAGSLLTPYVLLAIKTKDDRFEWHELLFDTGADFTSFPRFVAHMAGINLEKCPQEIMYTANNEPMVTYHAKITIRFGAEAFQLPCVFTDRDDTPFLLGRVGFIDRFDMLLSARERKLIFQKIKK